MKSSDTIAAISTAIGSAGIGIVRLSGPDALSICSQVVHCSVPVTEMPANTFRYGKVLEQGHMVDEAVVLVFRAPHSYTGEDVAEIQCHGGTLVMQKILEMCIRSGARPAEAGEFSKRAFFNGRMDLSQAEAVMDVIAAQNERMLSNSARQLEGAWGSQLRGLREEMLLVMAYIEASLDDPEHYDLDGYSKTLLDQCSKWRTWIQKTAGTASDGARMREGVHTVLVGKPNVGKSSLLNTLSGRDRAIVTAIPGTTRDLIEETVTIGDVTLRLVDTAGLRETTDLVEQLGVDRSLSEMNDAQLILAMVDLSSELTEEEKLFLTALPPDKTILAANKQDLDAAFSEADLKTYFQGDVCLLSTKTGEGLEELRKMIRRHAYQNQDTTQTDLYVTNQRHLSALLAADQSLALVMEGIESGMPEDVLMIDLTDARDALGKITGETVSDELADAIFANFCMGK